MRKEDVRTKEEAILYLLDCTLATVDTMIRIKSKSRTEYNRQKSIAQFAIDFIKDSDIIIPKGDRAYNVVNKFNSSVEDYAQHHESILHHR